MKRAIFTGIYGFLILALWSQTAWAGSKASFKLTVKNNGKSAGFEYVLLTTSSKPEVVDKGKGKGTVTLKAAADTYKLKVTLTEALDEPTETVEEIDIKSDGSGKGEVKFSTGTLTLTVFKGGRKKKCNVKLRRPGGGQWLPSFKTGKSVSLSAGEYEAKVTIGKVPHTVSGIFVMEGATQTIPIQL